MFVIYKVSYENVYSGNALLRKQSLRLTKSVNKALTKNTVGHDSFFKDKWSKYKGKTSKVIANRYSFSVKNN